jgi:Ca2+-binding RTX toxin-like protein
LGDDLIDAGGSDDTIRGDGGNDIIDGGTGNDALIGGSGNDTIDGGADNDTAVFLLSRDHYNITFSGSQVIVAAIFQAPLVYEGTDTITNVENFEFAGTVYSREQLIALLTPPGNPAGGTGDQSGAGNGGYSGGGTGTVLNGPDVIPGNVSSTFAIGTAGQALTSAIETAGDRDYVQVYLVQGDTYRITMQGAANHGYAALQDSFFRVRDGQDHILASPTDQAGSDQLDYVASYTGIHFISIGAGGSNFATLTGGCSLTVSLISAPVANHVPVANTDDQSVKYGQVVTGNVLINDTDVDHNTLSVDFISSFHTALGGTVDLLPNGAFQYIAPGSGPASAQDSFSYVVRDGAGGSATGTVHLNLSQAAGGGLFTTGDDFVTVPTGGGIYHALSGNDVVFGSNYSDIVYGEDGNDFLHGLDGNDYLVGGNGDDGLVGGPGDDWLVPGAGRNQIWGDGVSSDFNGFDTVDYSDASGGITVNLQQGTVTGGGVNDLVNGIDSIIGSGFADFIQTYSFAQRAYGGGGNDSLIGWTGDDEFHGGTGDDNIQGYIGNDRLYGDDGNDTITGGDGNDLLNGGAGDDQVFGENNDDYIIASAGTDRLGGNDGTDTVDFSEAPAGFTSLGVVSNWGTSTLEGIEIVIATPFDDNFSAAALQELRLGAGNDDVTASSITRVFGDAGNDRIFALDVGQVFGGAGDDVLVALATTIELYGDDGNDQLSGGDGVDHKYYGGAGNDTLLGATGNEILSGDAGDDQISGGGGNDTVLGGAGSDTLAGEGAADKFVFDASAIADAQAATPVFDRITDYNFAEGDQIDLSALLAAAYSHGGGQPVSALVRAVEDAGNNFAYLQIDTDGSANGANFVTVARLDGLHPGNSLSVILDASLNAGSPITVGAAPAQAGSVSIDDVQITEGDGGTKVAVFTVTRTGGSAAFDVNFATTDGSATVADSDYVANSGTLHFADGVNTQTISVTINSDIKVEPDQTFFVNLSSATNGATIGDGQGIGTIANDDANHAPQVSLPSGTNVVATAGQVFAASSLFSVSDVDVNDVLTYFLYDGTAGGGHFVVNGAVQPAQTVFALSAAQLAQTTFVAGAASSSDALSVMAYDGQDYSNNTHFSSFNVNVPGVNHAPVVTIPQANVSATAGQSFAASSLFTVSDADVSDVLTYYLYDSTAGGGHFVINGTQVADQTVVAISASQLAQTTFVAGAAGSSDALSVMAYDGHDYSNSTHFSSFNVSVPAVNHAPVVMIPQANVSATAGQSFAASSLFSITDSDVNDVLTYFLYDGTPGGGHFVVNGSTVAAQTVVALSAGQLAQTTFVAGAAGSSDALSVMAYDGHDYSNNTHFSSFNVSVPSANHAPTVTIPQANVSASAGQAIAASSLFSASDLDGDTLTYFLYDATPGATSGHISVNGSTVPAQTVVALSAAQIAQTTFVAGTAGSNDDFQVMVYDGHDYSGNTSFSHFHLLA